VDIVFKIVKGFIEAFRRITGIYYNIGVVEASINLEEFRKRVTISIFVKQTKIESFRIMSVRGESMIIVSKSLETDIHNKILDYMVRVLTTTKRVCSFLMKLLMLRLFPIIRSNGT